VLLPAYLYKGTRAEKDGNGLTEGNQTGFTEIGLIFD
jgi:hypothetical protein